MFEAVEFNIAGVCVPPFFIPSACNILNDSIILTSPIDYPCGLGDPKVREHAVLRYLRKGANAIDLVLNAHHIINNKLDLVEADLKTNIATCYSRGATLRVMIDYRLFTSSMLTNIGKLLQELKVEYLLPSTGQILDSSIDNIIISRWFTDNFGLNVIANGRFYNASHFQQIKNARIFGVRINNIAALRLFCGV